MATFTTDPPDPLRFNVSIVDIKNGTPTQEFIRQWNRQRAVNITVDSVTVDLTAIENAIADIQDVDIVAGVGLSGGGNISGPSDVTLDLEDTAVTPGTYGNSTNSPQITIDQQGRITAAANVAISGGGSGGGSGSGFLYAPPAASLLPLVASSTGFSTTSSDAANLGLSISGTQSTAGNKAAVYGKAPPSAPFSISARILFTPWASYTAESHGRFGLVLYNSSTGESVRLKLGPAEGFVFQRWSALGTFAANFGTISNSNSSAANQYLRLSVDGSGNITAFFSTDGAAWRQLGSAQTVAATLSGSITHAGLFISMNQNGGTADMLVPYYEETT